MNALTLDPSGNIANLVSTRGEADASRANSTAPSHQQAGLASAAMLLTSTGLVIAAAARRRQAELARVLRPVANHA